MNGYEAFTFAIMVLVTPLFLAVFAIALLACSPVLLPLWLLERRRG